MRFGHRRLFDGSGRQAAFFLGTLAPFLRASERPIAIACFRLVTLPPLPPLPERSVPRFSRRMALATDLPTALPYLRPLELLRELELFFGAIWFLLALQRVTKKYGLMSHPERGIFCRLLEGRLTCRVALAGFRTCTCETPTAPVPACRSSCDPPNRGGLAGLLPGGTRVRCAA